LKWGGSLLGRSFYARWRSGCVLASPSLLRASLRPRLRLALPFVRTSHPTGVQATAPLQQSTSGGSASFLVLADDTNRYWCKVLNNPQGQRVPINEQIVARLGLLVGAPVCTPELVYIPAALAGWEYRPGVHLEEGWAHGSLALDSVVETRTLDERSSDDNARRHAGIWGLHDWVGGADSQWLVRGAEREYFSHDHGHYFPGGPAWTVEGLQAAVTTPYPFGGTATGLDGPELERLAGVIEAATQEEVEGCVAKVPAAWPVTDAELQAVVSFVLDRRQPVAARLRALAGAV
jgi:hypothetical protein